MALVAASPGARAAALGTASFTGGSECPSPSAVVAALDDLLDPATWARLPWQPGEQVVLRDEGGQYEIALRDLHRRVDDPGRDCRARAQVAAISVVLTLAPPQVDLARLFARSAPGPAPARAARAQMWLAGALAWAGGAEGSSPASAPAVQLGYAARGEVWGWAADLVGAGVHEYRATGWGLRERRLGVGVEWQRRARWRALSASLGAGPRWHGSWLEPRDARAAFRQQWGGTATLALHGPGAWALRPFVAARAALVPDRHRLVLAPIDQTVARTPLLWLHVLAGLSVELP